MNTLGNKRVELFDMGAGVSEPTADENFQVASCETYLPRIHKLIPVFVVITWVKRTVNVFCL